VTVRYRRHPAVATRELNGSLFLAHPERGTVYRLNASVAALWRLLEQATSMRDAVAVFRAAFVGSKGRRVREAVGVMVSDLLREGLIEVVTDAASAGRNPPRK
jgi:hypothetical protein